MAGWYHHRRRIGASHKDLADIRPARSLTLGLMRRAFELRANVTTHDTCYIALAEALDWPLCTIDRRRAHASGSTAGVVDAYQAFLDDSRGVAALLNADGLHPSDAAGSPLWRDQLLRAVGFQALQAITTEQDDRSRQPGGISQIAESPEVRHNLKPGQEEEPNQVNAGQANVGPGERKGRPRLGE